MFDTAFCYDCISAINDERNEKIRLHYIEPDLEREWKEPVNKVVNLCHIIHKQ